MSLPTNYKDQVLDASMNGLRQYAQIKNSNGTYSFRDVSVYSQVGSTLAADDINDITSEINTVETTYARQTDLTSLATKSELTSYATKSELTGYATKSEISSCVTLTGTEALSNKTYESYTLGDACEKTVDTSLTASTTSTNLPTSKAVVDYVASQSSATDAMVFKGTIGSNAGDTYTDLPTAAVKVGDTYKITTAGTYNSQVCKIGDFFIALTDAPTWSYIPAGDETVAVTQTVTSGTEIATITIDGADTKIYSPAMPGVFSTTDNGLVPKATATDKYLKGDGTWAAPVGTTYSVFSTTENGLVPLATDTNKYLKGDGTWATPANNNTTYSLTQDATDGHKITLTPSSGVAQTITIPDNNTTYGVFDSTNDGLVPKVTDTTKYLKGDGTWATPTNTNTTYSMTQDATDGHKITLTPSSGTAQTVTIPDNDTKNTAGSTASTSKLFIIGATSQAANPQTYSRSTCFIGTDGCLYSNSAKVSTFTEVTGTLAAGSTSIALSNAAITTSSTIDVYTGTYGVSPSNMTVVAGKVTLEFAAQEAALSVKIRVS